MPKIGSAKRKYMNLVPNKDGSAMRREGENEDGHVSCWDLGVDREDWGR